MYSIAQYTTSHYSLWNDFIAQTKNGTFLFHRDYMEYHSDRFEDFSLLLFNNEKLVAVFPANREGGVVHSHKGLTYGGLLYGNKTKLADVIVLYRILLEYLANNTITTLHVKPVPAIYHKFPAQEQEYVLFLLNATLSRRDGLSVIDRNNLLPVTKSRKEAIRRGVKNGLSIAEEPNFKLFWEEILIPNLQHRHKVKPVHSLEEIIYLHNKFPDRIRHFNVYDNDRIVAGTTVYLTDTVAHPQYISGEEDRNALGSLDYLYNHIIDLFADKRYFDFGPSTEEQGLKLNHGLVFWKESFGARTIIQDFYEIDTANFGLLDTVLI
ncbi:GNAT family N-acetyltransferase [Flavobacterium litorale]|uniref:GNAT family N-acetyltransferase n=1 Tax=Flavobacterium litorale TaxID=2856519 RepID=A0ABX8V8E4_9FLAO|nr:GNAT family N-acetyltransferase [Flavobacterium litorale]QYJ67483.1 GNAT family N-acetyltransferase [Flavobacterium litorale]